MIHTSGYLCILLALLASLGGAGLAIIQLWEGSQSHAALAGKAHWVISACLLLAAALLLHALFWEDYSLEYVASYTDKDLSIFYRLTAFWAGQPGSMLFWAAATAVAGSIFACASARARQSDRARLWFWALFYSITAFFCLVLAAWSNPFIVAEPAPVDGNGLNPLLQNPGMIFHPPLLFMGYAGFTVPACLALAQLLDSNEAPDWFRVTRPFYIISWCLLTAGIILGAWWAYMELGWGGYWAWDPVENSSLLPWLMACAAIHIVIIQSRSGKLGATAACLMALTVVAAFFATYLTRSGVIQSVHAFGDGGVGTPLTVFVLAALFLSMSICAVARKKAGAGLAQPVSREGALMLTAWLFIALAVIILAATMWPVISQIWGGASRGLDAAFYNRVCLPLGAGLVVLLCVCFWLGWQGGFTGQGRFYATLGAFIASGAAIWLAGYRQPLALIAAAGSIAAICAMFMRAPEAGRRGLAAIGIHLGVAVITLGIAFSGPYTTDREILFARGQMENIGPFQVSLEDIKDGQGRGYDYLQATVRISRGGRTVGILKPERRIYDKFGDMQFSEVDVISSLARDIYVSLLGMDEDRRVLVKISLEPLVNWIWIGGAMLCLLPLAGLGRGKQHA